MQRTMNKNWETGYRELQDHTINITILVRLFHLRDRNGLYASTFQFLTSERAYADVLIVAAYAPQESY